MSLFGFDNGACRRCHLNGKCEEQKAIIKGLSDLANKINIEHEDNSVVGSFVVVCNRAGE